MKAKAILNKILWIISAMFLFCCFFLQASVLSVKAEENIGSETKYTNVLDDLSKDETFNVEDYPKKPGDYSLNIIQIAESSDKELFVYVYEPSAKEEIWATSINISTEGTGENVQNYTLTLVNEDGVFGKYVVNDFTVKNDVLRYYNITSIYRAYDYDFDGDGLGDNKVVQTAYGVGQLWTATTSKGEVIYSVQAVEFITVTSKHVGFIRYIDLKLITGYSYTDSHYVAFSTDKPIDKLLKAEIMFSHQWFYKQTNSSLFVKDIEQKGNKIDETKTLLREEIFSKNSWFHDDYEYNRIQSIDEFFAGEDEILTDETQTALKDTKWVLRFYESGYSYLGGYTTDASSIIQNYQESYTYTVVTDVSILRLEFEYDGKLYNMGVVDNISSGDTNPDNENPEETDFGRDWKNFLEEFKQSINDLWNNFRKVIGIVVVILVIAALLTLFPPILTLFVWIFKVIWWVIAFPFNLISKWRKRRKAKKQQKEE